MTQLVEGPIRYRDNPAGILWSALMTVAFALMLTIATIVFVNHGGFANLDFAGGGSCYVAAHSSICK